MYKKLIVSTLFAVVLIPTMALASFPNNEKYGQHDAGTIELQEFLISQNDLNISKPTGYFYALTFAGVKKFQSENGLPVTGYFGILSRAKANELIDLTPSDTQEKLDTGTIANIPSVISPSVDQNTQLLQQIVQNTTPPVINTPIDTTPPQVKNGYIGWSNDRGTINFTEPVTLKLSFYTSEESVSDDPTTLNFKGGVKGINFDKLSVELNQGLHDGEITSYVDSNLTSTHTILNSNLNLTPGLHYYVKVEATDEAGNTFSQWYPTFFLFNK